MLTALVLILLSLGPSDGMVRVEGGELTPLYTVGPRTVKVEPFLIDRYPVTNSEFLEFVRQHPEWRRSRVKRVFADQNYLGHWKDDLGFEAELADSPVVNVSWFAARAYARAQGKRLPRQEEWEFAALAKESEQKILDWYSKPTPQRLPAVGSTFASDHGVWDMHGLAWEWVDDFNTVLVTGESRADTGLNRDLFCAAGVIGSTDPSDYASYMRYAFRSSLKAHYTVRNLGFRCAADVPEKEENR